MSSRYTPRFCSVMKVGRIALLVGLSVLLSVRPVHAKNGKLTVAGTVVTVTGVITAVVGGNPRQKSDPTGKVIGIGLLLSAVGSFMIYTGMTGPVVVVAPQRHGASVTITHGW